MEVPAKREERAARAVRRSGCAHLRVARRSLAPLRRAVLGLAVLGLLLGSAE